MYKIMIVDDDKLARLGLINSVRWSIFNMKLAFETAHGEAAISYAEENTVDLVFLDLEMPGMHGIELLKKLKIASPKTRCVILTMHDEFSFIQEALRIGVMDYIIKTELAGDNIDQIISRLKNRLEDQGKTKLNEYGFRGGDSISYEIKKCIASAMELVESEKGVYLTATDIAKRVNMSRSYFSTCFKQLLGQTFNEYFKQTRLELAKEALIETDKSISQIAEDSGFSNESYFSTVFKNQTGKTPSDFRHFNDNLTD